MKKHIITRIVIIACVALCAAVWPRSAGDGKVPAELKNTAVIAEFEARSEESAPTFLSDDTFAPEPEITRENEPAGTGVTVEEETQKPESTPKVQSPKPSTTSSEPRMGDVRVVNGEKQIYILGFGWIKDEVGGSVEITVDGEGDINKQVGVMGGGSTVGNPGDELTGNKVGIMGGGSGGTVAGDMYENGNKIGSMGGEEPQNNTSSPPTEQPTSNDDEIHIVFVETPEKNSTPPPYKPDTTSP